MFTVDFRFEENQTTIEFPCNEEFLSAKFDELGVEDKLKTSQYMIGTNYAALKRLVTDFVDADELNFLAKRLDSFDKNELNIFEAVCEARAPRSLTEIINVTYNIHNYTLVQDMSSMGSIGRTHFKAVHIGWNPGASTKMFKPPIAGRFIFFLTRFCSKFQSLFLPRAGTNENMCSMSSLYLRVPSGGRFPEYLFLRLREVIHGCV